MDSLQLLVMVFALSVNPANADTAGARAAKSGDSHQRPAAFAPADRRLKFGSQDRVVIQDYYRSNPSSSPRALGKQDALPREAAIERYGRLPIGADVHSLPIELARQLSPLPHGYARVIVGKDIVLLKTPTQMVVDVMHDVIG